MLRVKSGYVKGRSRERANEITSVAKREGLEERILAKAVNVAETARSIAQAEVLTAGSAAESRIIQRYADSFTVVDGGKDYRRRSFPSGSIIPVALVVTEDAGFSAPFAEYGQGSIPGVYALTKAVIANGGTTT